MGAVALSHNPASAQLLAVAMTIPSAPLPEPTEAESTDAELAGVEPAGSPSPEPEIEGTSRTNALLGGATENVVVRERDRRVVAGVAAAVVLSLIVFAITRGGSAATDLGTNAGGSVTTIATSLNTEGFGERSGNDPPGTDGTEPSGSTSIFVPGSLLEPSSTLPAAVGLGPGSPTTRGPTLPSTTRPAPATTAPAPRPQRGRVIAADAPAVQFGTNVYGNIGPDNANPATADHRSLVYVPHEVSGTTMVIDPVTKQVIDTFTSGAESQHVVPSFDMTKLYAVSGQGGRITPIDPVTGKPEAAIPARDAYNLYFTPDGAEAIIVAEGAQRLDFVDAQTFEPHSSVQTQCYGLNHLDYSADFSYFLATCEFEGAIIKFDMASRRVIAKMKIDMTPSGRIPRRGFSMPQDIRLSSDGSVFFVADLQSDGLYLIDGDSLRQVGFLPAGVGTHSLYPSRDGKRMYVINRGTGIIGGPPHGAGSVSVLDPYRREIIEDWPIPGGGSPDMGNVTWDGSELWLGGRYDSEVYVFDLVWGGLKDRIPVGTNPHGLTVWPQPGRFSLGHTGNTR